MPHRPSRFFATAKGATRHGRRAQAGAPFSIACSSLYWSHDIEVQTGPFEGG